MNIISSLRKHFDEKGIVKGTQEIVDTAAAVILVSAVTYVAVKQVKTYMSLRNARNTTADAPIDVAKAYGSSTSMLRNAKQSRKQIKKQLEKIEKAAIDRLSVGRNRMFLELSYPERRAILEGEGIDVQEVEQQIQDEKSLLQERRRIQAERERSQKSFFNRIRRLFPSQNNIGSYTIPMDQLRKTNDAVVYNSIQTASWRKGKKQSPTAAVPNRFIVKPTGEIMADTYEAKAARTKAINKLVSPKRHLPRIPNKFNKFKFLSKDVQKAYLEMRGQVARVCGARLNPFDQQTHSNVSIKDRAKALQNAWESHKYLMSEQQKPWYGDKSPEDQGRSTNSPDNGEKVGKEIDSILEYMEENGIDPNSLTGGRHHDALDALLYSQSAARHMMESDMLDDEITTDQILATGGVDPKDVPFFDTKLYDTDLDPLLSEPQRPILRVKHRPLKVPQFNVDEQELDPGFIPAELRTNVGVHPTHFTFGKPHVTDFNKTSYTQLHQNATKAFRSQLEWRRNHPRPASFLEEVELGMYHDHKPMTPRAKRSMEILMDDDLGVMSSKKSDKKKQKKKGKKKDEVDYFASFGHPSSKKDSKNKKKKKKGKKGKHEDELFMSSLYDDDNDGPYPGSTDITQCILSGIGDTTRKRLARDIKRSKEGKLYSR